MTKKKTAESTEKLRANEQKWGKTLVNAGWTLVPSTILERQQALKLDPVDLNIILQLARHWWLADNPPHPSIKTIADCIGKSVSTVQRRLKRLERSGVIEIVHRHNSHGGQTSSKYLFTGLIEQATVYAKEAIEDHEKDELNKARRRVRRQPRTQGKK